VIEQPSKLNVHILPAAIGKNGHPHRQALAFGKIVCKHTAVSLLNRGFAVIHSLQLLCRNIDKALHGWLKKQSDAYHLLQWALRHLSFGTFESFRMNHSHRSAVIGSTREALRAGRYPATAATAIITSAASAMVAGSFGSKP
jgi:hypothetical protein